MPVSTTIKAEREGSAPVNRAPANARGVVMQRVSGARAVTDEGGTGGGGRNEEGESVCVDRVSLLLFGRRRV